MEKVNPVHTDLKNLSKIQDNFLCVVCNAKVNYLFTMEFINKADVLHTQTSDQLSLVLRFSLDPNIRSIVFQIFIVLNVIGF